MGEALAEYYGLENEVVILTRQEKPHSQYARYVKWDGEHLTSWYRELDKADLLINLAGKSVNCRYNERNKAEIFSSRVNSTRVLGEAIKRLPHPPALWINAASATIYRHAEDRPMDERNGDIGTGFSVEVCKLWEKTFYEQETPQTRKVALRTAIVLGPKGGALMPMLNLVKFALGGRQGSGHQMFSWVHIEDFCRLAKWLYETPEAQGTYNCSAPQPVTNETFMRTLRQAAGHRIGLPAPEWLLRMGAVMIGTEIELIIKSRWVIPARLVQEGFRFRHAQLRPALEDILSELPRRRYHLF